jgi:hypothetical protein
MAGSSLIPEAERPRYVKPEFLKGVASLDPIQWLPKLRMQHIRLQQVGDDSITPAACQKAIDASAGQSVQVVRYNDTAALFQAVSGGKLFDWIKQQVMPESQQQKRGGTAS